MTNEEKKRLYQQLSAPFPESAIQRTDGRVTGKGYDTTGIGYQHIVNRLNEVVGLGNWRTHREITVKPFTTPKGRAAYEAICDLILEMGQWDAEGKFIPFAEALADGGHNSMNEADARKGSFTNALKKAAAFFGVGKQAYEGSIDDDNTPAEPMSQVAVIVKPPSTPATLATQVVPVASLASEASQRSQPPAPAPPPIRNRLTSKQLAALWAMARKVGMDQSQFRQSVKQREGVQPEFLSRESASRLIGELSDKLNSNGHAENFEPRQVGQEG